MQTVRDGEHESFVKRQDVRIKSYFTLLYLAGQLLLEPGRHERPGAHVLRFLLTPNKLWEEEKRKQFHFLMVNFCCFSFLLLKSSCLTSVFAGNNALKKLK